MEYFVYDTTNQILGTRDGFTSTSNRVSIKVKSFQIRERYYEFEFEKHEKLQYSRVFLPIDATVLSFV